VKETEDLLREEAYILICNNSTLLVQLKVGPTKDIKASEVRYSLGLYSF